LYYEFGLEVWVQILDQSCEFEIGQIQVVVDKEVVFWIY
jgi:hypothetical protein